MMERRVMETIVRLDMVAEGLLGWIGDVWLRLGLGLLIGTLLVRSIFYLKMGVNTWLARKRARASRRR